MINVEYLTKTYGSHRAVDDLSLVRPGRLSRLVIVAVRSIIAKSWLGPRLLTRARRTPTA
jgi:hypothetical protein